MVIVVWYDIVELLILIIILEPGHGDYRVQVGPDELPHDAKVEPLELKVVPGRKLAYPNLHYPNCQWIPSAEQQTDRDMFAQVYQPLWVVFSCFAQSKWQWVPVEKGHLDPQVRDEGLIIMMIITHNKQLNILLTITLTNIIILTITMTLTQQIMILLLLLLLLLQLLLIINILTNILL